MPVIERKYCNIQMSVHHMLTSYLRLIAVRYFQLCRICYHNITIFILFGQISSLHSGVWNSMVIFWPNSNISHSYSQRISSFSSYRFRAQHINMIVIFHDYFLISLFKHRILHLSNVSLPFDTSVWLWTYHVNFNPVLSKHGFFCK